MTPIVAIIGRPNVGKSTLFNRLAGKALAIVHDAPGVTRDRHYVDAFVQSRELVLVDTGGFDPESEDPMGQGIARQVRGAVAEADVVLCVLDAQSPPTEADLTAVRLLRESRKPVVYAANRVDNPRIALEALELHRLGVEPLVLISALHGRGMVELENELAKRLPPRSSEERPAMEDDVPHLALIGRPNAGKSSLFNLLSGSERSLVDARPGTTTDPVDLRLSYRGQDYVVVDTAGVRRRPHVEEGVEAASVMRALRAIPLADVAVLVCDAGEVIAEQDQRLLGMCIDRARAVVVALNKTDLLKPGELKQALANTKHTLHFAPWAPIIPISAKTGEGVQLLMRTVRQVFGQFTTRVTTGALNRFFQQVLANHPPPTHRGRAPRLYYMTQASTRPPVFVAMCNSPEHIKVSYQRFVSNQIRTAFGFANVPVRVHYRGKK